LSFIEAPLRRCQRPARIAEQHYRDKQRYNERTDRQTISHRISRTPHEEPPFRTGTTVAAPPHPKPYQAHHRPPKTGVWMARARDAVEGLAKTGDQMTAGELAAATALGRGTVSTTLSTLAATGVVVEADRGYRLPSSTDG
jgi:biotin operon repressor